MLILIITLFSLDAKEKALKGFELYNEIEENAEGEVIKESTVGERLTMTLPPPDPIDI